MYELSDNQRTVIKSVRAITKTEFVDDAYRGEGDVPWENVRTLADHGFVGLNFDERYGGGGLSDFLAVLLVETVGRSCPDTAAYLAEQQLVAPRAIHSFGSETVKERYLPLIISGEGGIAIAISEPEAGSDVGSMSTTVTEDGGQLTLNGEKMWVSRVSEYDAAVVWVKFEGEGLGSIVVDFSTSGVEVGQQSTNMAGHTQTQLFFDDVQIPVTNVLTRGEEAFGQQLRALNWERLSVAATMNAVALRSLEEALEYSQYRKQFGTPIGDFQGIEWKFADMITRIQASRALIAAAVPATADATPDPLNANISKLYSTEMAEVVVDEALQIHGATGYQQGNLLEYLYRFVRGYRIAGGTDEIHKNTIASLLTRDGVPRTG